jgi:hypothetical protein
MKNLATRVALGFFYASLLACGLVFLAYLYAARPLADDFGRATCASSSEAIARTAHDYLYLCGRWASIGIEHIGWSLIPQRTPNIGHYYSIFLGLVLLASFGGLFAIMSCLLRGSTSSNLLRSSVVALFYFSFFHSPAETLFWIPGAAEGGLAVVLMCLAVWLVLNGLTGGPKYRPMTYIEVGLCLLLGAGCHELAGMTATAFFSLLSAWYFFRNNRRVPALVVFALVISIIATAISVFAPGNSVRSALYVARAPGTEEFTHASIPNALNSLSQLLLRTMRVILSVQLLLGIPAALIFLRKSRSVRPNLLAQSKLVEATGISMLIALLAVVLIYAFRIGNIPAGRTVNFFCTSLFLVAVPAMMIAWLGRPEPSLPVISDRLQPWLVTLLAISIFTGPTLDRGFFSYKKGLIPWIRYQENRHHLLLQAGQSGESEVVLDPGPPPPYLLFLDSELGTDAEAWGNKIQAGYYGVHSIRIKPDVATLPKPRK